MDGSDASLIEISEEDDSLLSSPLLPTDAASPPSSFACSPLVRFPRPPLPGSSSRRSRLPPLPLGGGREEGREPGSKDGSEKENDEVNKLEAGKLSLEPQQMKRKKKGAGFNLRKSLAWNRAFFTEEGVLDPSELSMLSGNTGDSTGLSTIQEGIESLCSGSDAANTSPSLRKLENKLSGELPVNSVIQGRKLKRTMLPKPGSATRDKSGSVSAAKRKVIASPDANKSASKRGGYPLSTALSSLRKPSTGSMTKVVNKGSKLSRLFTSKPDPAIASVSRSHTVAASQLKQNQIAKPVTIQKSDAAKITSANVKAVRENVKCAPLGNSLRKPIEQFKRNVVRSGSSANVRHHATNQTADKEAKVRDVLLHPAACSPNVADVGVLKTVNSFSQNAANVRHTQPQAAKPSGLRMPSPSLGYFSESKTSGSQSLPQRTQLCNLQQSGIPTSTSAGVLKPTQLRPPLPRKKMDHSSTGNLIASMANPVLHGKGKCNAQSDAIRDLEVEVLCSSKSLKSNPLVHSITSNELQNFDLGRPNNDGNVSDTEDQMPLSNLQNGATKLSKLDVGDNERVTIADSQQKSTELISDHLMVAPHLSLQAVTEVLSETQTMTSGQEVDPLFHNIASNHVISSEVQFENVNCNIENNVSKVPENRSRSMHDGKKQLQEQAETKPFVDADSEWLMTEKSLKTADGSRVNDLENLSDCLSFCEGAEEVKCVADEADHLSKASQVGDANVQAIDFDVPVQEVDPLFHNIASSRVISSRVQFENANCNIEKDVSKVSANRSCSMHDGNKQLQEQAEMKPFVDADSEWIKTEKSLKAADGGRVNDLENLPDCLSFCKGAEEVKNVADEADHLSNASQVRDANIQAIDFVAPVQSSKNGIHSLNDDMPYSLLGDSNQEWAETFEFHHGFCVVKQTSFCDHVSSNNACLLPGQSLSSKPSIDDDVIQSVRSVPETFDHRDGLTDCSINCPQEFFRRDFGLDAAVKAHQLHEGNAPTGHEIKEVAFHSSSHIVELQGGSGSMLLDCKDQVSHNIPNCQMELTDVCLNSECIMESDLGDTNLNSKFNTLMHVEVVSKFNERNDHELFLGEQVNHYDEQSVEAAQSQGSYDNRVFEDEKSTKDAVGSFTENFTDFVEICESSRGNANNVSRGIIEKHENNHVEAENMVKERENHFQSDARPEDDFDISVSAVNSKSPMVELDTSGSFQECSESQIFNLVTGELSIMNQDVLSDDDLSSMDISSTESEDSFADTDSIVEGTILNSSDQNNDLVTEHMDEKLECSDTSPREALVSGGFADSVLDTEVPPAVHSSDLDMDKNSSDHHMHADAVCFLECEISVENDPCSDVCKSENHSECREYDTSLELDSSLKKPGALIQVAGDNIIRNLPCSSNRELESVKGNAMSNDDCQQTEAQLPSSSIISQETTEEDEDATSEMCKPENDEKKGALTIKPPPDAVPFSDEWLAAFEAAGEEILTMKSGAVQNSPPDKSGPEPSPWSPVRRKNNQEIGPFDCTKFAKIDAPMSTEVKEK